MTTNESTALTATGVTGVLTGVGVLTFALFPLALPFVLLTIAFTAPLALLLIPALLVAVLGLAIGAVYRRASAIRPAARSSAPARAPVPRRRPI